MNGQHVSTRLLNRRRILQGAGMAGLGLLAGCTLPFAAPPPSVKVHRIAYLTGAPPNAATAEQMGAFRQGLSALGYVEGQNLLIDERYASGFDQLADPAAELVRLQPEVLVAAGVPVARALLAVSNTIPIVSAGVGGGGPDLVASGLAASRARPGGTVTGLNTPALEGKQLQLLQEAVPPLARVAILFDSTLAGFEREPFEVPARTLGLQLQFVGARDPRDLESIFETLTREHAEGLVAVAGPVITGSQAGIAALAVRHQLPSMWQQSEAIERGGLLAHGSNRVNLYRQAATYAAKILQGTRPADLPIEEPREFDFLVNLQTAQTLGLTIPQHVLLQATEVIQ
jgi:putative tryptophan/tyrosine transport system substrate-binding protein